MEIVDELPTALSYLFDTFAELSVVRRVGFSGPEPIGFDQIYFWQLASGFKLRAWERKLLLRIDAVWRRVQQKDYAGPKLRDDDDGR